MKLFKIISTYILADLFIKFVVMQVGFTLLFVIIGIFMQDVLSNMPVRQIPLLIPYIFPFSQSFGGQLVMVFTCVMCYSRMVQSNEIVALRSSGISSWRVMFPSFLLAFVMSLVAFWMTDLNYSWGKQGIQRVTLSSLESIIYRKLETDKSYGHKNYSFSVNRVEGKKLYDLFFMTLDSAQTQIFSAESAQISIGPAAKIIEPGELCYLLKGSPFQLEPFQPELGDETVLLKLAVFHPDFQVDRSQVVASMECSIVVSMDELSDLTQDSVARPSAMNLEELNRFVEQKQLEIRNCEQEIALHSARVMMAGDLGVFAERLWEDGYYARIKECQKRIRRAKIEPVRRLAFALNCFCLTWVCAPLSLRKGHLGALTLLCVGVLPLLFIYFPMTMLTLQLVKETKITPLILLLPNMVLLILGVFLIRKVL